MASPAGFLALVKKLRRERQNGRLIFGLPMAPGSIQAFAFFWVLKKLGAVTHLVDFNLINADVITPPRRRYIFDRHLAQAAELFKCPEWTTDSTMPLALTAPEDRPAGPTRRIGLFPWSGRGWLAEFRWPDARWTELTKRLLAQGEGDIILLGRDAGFERLEGAIRSQLSAEESARFLVLPANSVASLAASLRSIDYLITLNTSALHLAHALRLPLVALCGSSAESWLPEGGHVRLVRDEGGILPPSDRYAHDALQPSLQGIEVEQVFSNFLELVQSFPAKSP